MWARGLSKSLLETYIFEEAEKYHGPICDYIETSLVEKYGDDKDLEWIAHEMVRDAYTKINASCACQGWPESTNKQT
jgi:hypothetical protein